MRSRGNLCALLAGIQICTANVENSMGTSQTIKNITIMQSISLSSGIYPKKETITQIHIYTPHDYWFIKMLFTITKT